MLDTIEKWEYRAKAKVPGAKEYLQKRLSDYASLPMKGLHGEALKLTGLTELKEKIWCLKQHVRGGQDCPGNPGCDPSGCLVLGHH